MRARERERERERENMRSDVSSSVHGGAVAAKDEPRETLREAIEVVLRGAGPEGLTAKEIGAAVLLSRRVAWQRCLRENVLDRRCLQG